jgi:hypothetical protein
LGIACFGLMLQGFNGNCWFVAHGWGLSVGWRLFRGKDYGPNWFSPHWPVGAGGGYEFGYMGWRPSLAF